MPEPQPIGSVLGDKLADILTQRGIDPEIRHKPLTGAEWQELADREPAEIAAIEQAIAYTDGRIPARYRQAEATDPAVADWAARLIAANGPRSDLGLGPSLLILGPTGVGKTHQAYGALRYLAKHGVRCKWAAYSAADLYAALRPNATGGPSEATFKETADAPLLVIDDLGAAKATEWTEEITYRLINRRYEHMLPTIFTSNVPPGELKTALGDRVASRLVEMCDRVVLKGDDRRRTA